MSNLATTEAPRYQGAWHTLPNKWWKDKPVIPEDENIRPKALYPRTLIANLEFRNRILDLAGSSKVIAEDLWIKCARNPLFFVNTFCYTYDPRLNDLTKLPFITYKFQDDAIMEIIDCIRNGEDLVIEKSRDMGASWIVLATFLWFMIFKDDRTFLLASRDLDLVDKTDDKDALMWKIDFMIDHLPAFLKPTIKRNNLHIGNKDNDSTIDGDASTNDLGRGGRRTAIGIDEYAAMNNGESVDRATADVTNCRIFISTHKGTACDFYTKTISKLRKISLHWSLHPVKSIGIYIGRDKKLRSPWYDRECERRSKKDVAENLDMDPIASGSPFFDQEKLDEIKRNARPPIAQGELEFDAERFETINFLERGTGRLKLWLNLDIKGHPPYDRDYVMGVDVSTGSGSSDSVISVIDQKSYEKVAEWKCNKTSQVELAKVAVALGRFFKGPGDTEAYMAWEANGPGQLFGRTVISCGYERYYFDRDEKSIDNKQSKRPGFYSTQEKKMTLLSEYRNALETGLMINPSADALTQCEFYVYINGTSVEHSRSHGSSDPTEKSANHGDEVIADALAWKGILIQVGVPKTDSTTPEPMDKAPANSFKARRQEYEAVMRKLDEWEY